MSCNHERCIHRRAISGQRGVTLERRQASDAARTLAGRDEQNGDSGHDEPINNGQSGRATAGAGRKRHEHLDETASPGSVPGRLIAGDSHPHAGKPRPARHGRVGPRATSPDEAPAEGSSPTRHIEDFEASLHEFRTQIAREVGSEAYTRYFGRDVKIARQGDRLTLDAPSRFLAGLLERRFGAMVRAAARATPGCERCTIDILSFEEPGHIPGKQNGFDPGTGRRADSRARIDAASYSPPAKGDDHQRPRPARAGANGRLTETDRRSGVGSGRYRLEDFIVGNSNRLAYDAAVRVAESEPPDASGEIAGELLSWSSNHRRAACSPLFLHGQCGLGKTHLLQGIAARFKQRRPGAIVRVTTGEAFTNDFISAIHGDGSRSSNHNAAGSGGHNGSSKGGRTGTGTAAMERFRKQYRKVDLLCIDDVHFLASKSATQTELLHTFNELELGGAQIVIACDEHPRLVKKISEALISRFMSGLVARIDPPDRDLCERIMRQFGERRGLVFEESALRALSARAAVLKTGPARSTRTQDQVSPGLSIREIEGLVTRVEASVRLHAATGAGGVCRVGLAAVQQVLGNLGPATAALARAFETTDSEHAPMHHHAAAYAIGESSCTTSRRPVRLEAIVAHTCRLLGVDLGEFTGTGRQPRTVLARSITAYLARRLTSMSYPDIARGMGRPSHSTIIAAAQRLEQQLAAADGSSVPGLDLTIGELCDRLAAAVVAQS